MAYVPKVYKDQGGDRLVVATGGSIVAAAGTITVGGVQIDTVLPSGVTASAAEINKLTGSGAVVASGTQHAHVADIGNSATGTQIATAVNAILAALEAFGINASA